MESSNYLFMNISILYRCGQKYYDKKLSEHKIGASQLLFLILIYENEGISMQNLAVKGSFDKGTITKSIARLEEQGFVKSKANADDKRMRCLFTTTKAKEIITEIYMIRRGWWERLTSGLGAQEEAQFKASLAKLCDRAKDLEEEEEDVHNIKLFGLQKLTLLDYPGEMASTIFTGGCNFRCPFCHNSDLVFLPENTAEIKKADILHFLTKRANVLKGVCVSGGEPLLHDGLEAFLRQVKQLGYKIKLDTNGSNPEKLKHLVDEKLIDCVAMDIKNAPKHYAQTVGLANMDMAPIEESVRYLLTNPIPYEFRTTIVKEFHTKEDMRSIGKWLSGAQHYYLQNFQDSAHVIQPGLHACTKEELQAFLTIVKAYIPDSQIRGM